VCKCVSVRVKAVAFSSSSSLFWRRENSLLSLSSLFFFPSPMVRMESIDRSKLIEKNQNKNISFSLPLNITFRSLIVGLIHTNTLITQHMTSSSLAIGGNLLCASAVAATATNSSSNNSINFTKSVVRRSSTVPRNFCVAKKKKNKNVKTNSVLTGGGGPSNSFIPSNEGGGGGGGGASSGSNNNNNNNSSSSSKRVDESVNLPPPRISDLERAPNERVASVLRSAIPGDLLLITTVSGCGGRQQQSSSSSSSVSTSQESSTIIRNSAVSTAGAAAQTSEESNEDRSERWFVVRESTAKDEDENNAVITLKGEIEGKNVTITLDTKTQSNNMEAELDVRDDSCFTNDEWMKQLGSKFRVELKSSKLKSKNFEKMKNLQRASKVVGCRSVVSYDLLKAAVKNDASPWRDGKSASTRRCIVEGLEAATQLAGELLAFEEKYRDVVMIQVSHSSELAPAGHLFYNAKEENQHDQNLRDYLERKRAAEFSGGGGGGNSSGSPGSPSSPSSSSSSSSSPSNSGKSSSSNGGWKLFENLFGSDGNGGNSGANAGRKVMNLKALWEPSSLQTIDAPYVLQTLHRIALENPDDVGFLSSNLNVDENSVRSVSLIMYRKSAAGAKERAEKLSKLRTQAAFNEQDWAKRIAVGSLLGYSQENAIWHAKALIDRHLVTPGDIMDAFDNALDIDEN